MAELPFFIAGGAKKTPEEQIQGAVRMLEELYQERVGGAYVGDVFEVDAGDVLTLRIGDSLEKTGGALAVLPSPAGGLQSTSNGLAIKLKAGGGLTVSADGLESSDTPAGNLDGDITRWNATIHQWEVKSEPLAFKGIKLTPMLEAAATEVEGFMYYNSAEKAVKVCTEV